MPCGNVITTRLGGSACPQSSHQTLEIIGPPAMAKGECDGEHLCIPMPRDAPRVTAEGDDLVLNVQFLEQSQEKARRPFHRDAARGKLTQDARSDARVPCHQV